jgi:HPt (histidine-containing phosphotransfer) domain-containing protein
MEHSNSDGALDPKALGNIQALQREGAPDIVVKVAKIFLGSSPSLLDDLCAAAADGDSARVGSAAHSLKSSSANLGALVLSEMCRNIEIAAKHGELPADGELAALAEQYSAACVALENLIQARAA